MQEPTIFTGTDVGRLLNIVSRHADILALSVLSSDADKEVIFKALSVTEISVLDGRFYSGIPADSNVFLKAHE